jgi:hypothetical protein
MAGTTGSLKALIEGAGLGVMVVRDRLPKKYTLPAIVLSDDVSTLTDAHGDFGDSAADNGVTEMATVDLFQAWRTRSGQVGESTTLADDLHNLLHGAPLLNHSKRVYGCKVIDRRRILEVDQKDGSKQLDTADHADVVHHAYTLLLQRSV